MNNTTDFSKKRSAINLADLLVPKEGVEPSLPKEHEFESCASTNSATLASVMKCIPKCFSICLFKRRAKVSNHV